MADSKPCLAFPPGVTYLTVGLPLCTRCRAPACWRAYLEWERDRQHGGPSKQHHYVLDLLADRDLLAENLSAAVRRMAEAEADADARFDYSDVAQPEACGWPDPVLVRRSTPPKPPCECPLGGLHAPGCPSTPDGEIAVYWPPLGETLGTAEWRSVVAMILRACDRADKENA